jgi:hypothetical protein
VLDQGGNLWHTDRDHGTGDQAQHAASRKVCMCNLSHCMRMARLNLGPTTEHVVCLDVINARGSFSIHLAARTQQDLDEWIEAFRTFTSRESDRTSPLLPALSTLKRHNPTTLLKSKSGTSGSAPSHSSPHAYSAAVLQHNSSPVMQAKSAGSLFTHASPHAHSEALVHHTSSPIVHAKAARTSASMHANRSHSSASFFQSEPSRHSPTFTHRVEEFMSNQWSSRNRMRTAQQGLPFRLPAAHKTSAVHNTIQTPDDLRMRCHVLQRELSIALAKADSMHKNAGSRTHDYDDDEYDDDDDATRSSSSPRLQKSQSQIRIHTENTTGTNGVDSVQSEEDGLGSRGRDDARQGEDTSTHTERQESVYADRSMRMHGDDDGDMNETDAYLESKRRLSAFGDDDDVEDRYMRKGSDEQSDNYEFGPGDLDAQDSYDDEEESESESVEEHNLENGGMSAARKNHRKTMRARRGILRSLLKSSSYNRKLSDTDAAASKASLGAPKQTSQQKRLEENYATLAEWSKAGVVSWISQQCGFLAEDPKHGPATHEPITADAVNAGDIRRKYVSQPLHGGDDPESATRLLEKMAPGMVDEVRDFTGHAAWAKLSHSDMIRRVSMYMARMNDMSALINGQMAGKSTVTVKSFGTDENPLALTQRPITQVMVEMVEVAAKLGNIQQTLGLLEGITDLELRRRAAKCAVATGQEHNHDKLVYALLRRHIKSRGIDVHAHAHAGHDDVFEHISARESALMGEAQTLVFESIAHEEDQGEPSGGDACAHTQEESHENSAPIEQENAHDNTSVHGHHGAQDGEASHGGAHASDSNHDGPRGDDDARAKHTSNVDNQGIARGEEAAESHPHGVDDNMKALGYPTDLVRSPAGEREPTADVYHDLLAKQFHLTMKQSGPDPMHAARLPERAERRLVSRARRLGTDPLDALGTDLDLKVRMCAHDNVTVYDIIYYIHI